MTSALIHGAAALIVATEGSGDREALTRFIGGIAFSELKIRTAPKQSILALKRYREGDYTGTSSYRPGPELEPAWVFGFHGNVISANYLF